MMVVFTKMMGVTKSAVVTAENPEEAMVVEEEVTAKEGKESTLNPLNKLPRTIRPRHPQTMLIVPL